MVGWQPSLRLDHLDFGKSVGGFDAVEDVFGGSGATFFGASSSEAAALTAVHTRTYIFIDIQTHCTHTLTLPSAFLSPRLCAIIQPQFLTIRTTSTYSFVLSTPTASR